MRNHTSALWDHFDKDAQQALGVCRYCKSSLSCRSTISNLKEHLKRKHRTVYDELVAENPGRG